VQLPPFVVVVTNLLVAAALAAGATVSQRLREPGLRRSALLGVLPLLDAALLGLFVFGEDSYRDNGISRWEAYRSPSGGALGSMFVLCLVLLGAAAALLGFAARSRRPRLLGATAFGAAVVCVLLVTGTIIGFSAN
jgi:glucan phosphoethanolaminetransferase (alkaline phosphatase superfamily)